MVGYEMRPNAHPWLGELVIGQSFTGGGSNGWRARQAAPGTQPLLSTWLPPTHRQQCLGPAVATVTPGRAQ